MAHTPGPWNVVRGQFCYHVVGEDGKFSTGCILFGDGDDPIDTANLIAAAPDLLAACEAIAEIAKFLPPSADRGQAKARFEDIEKIARAAVAQAKGE